MKLKFGLMAAKKPEEMFDVAKRHGMSHIELDLIREHSFVESFTAKRIAGINNMAKKYGMSLSLHIPYTVNPADEIPMIRKANVEYFRKCILLAARLKATHVTTHVGFYIGLSSWKEKRKQSLDRLALSLKELLPMCRKYGVCLALENVNPMPEGSEFFYLGDNIGDLEYLYSQDNSPYLKFCLDTGHANTNEGSVAYLKKFGDRLVSVHFHDNKGKLDEHLAIGDGTINWKNLVSELKKMKFCGPFVSEVFTSTPQEAREGLERYFSY
jgi:sugar phosphate isomerase/epimerase